MLIHVTVIIHETLLINFHVAGILHVVPSVSGLSAAEIVDRIHLQRERYKTKFAKKKAAEEEYYKDRYESEAAEMSKNMEKK